MSKRVAAYRPWHVLVNVIAASSLLPEEHRPSLLLRAGLDVAPSAAIRAGCFFHTADVSIGPGCMVNRGCYFDSLAHIRLGRNCFVAQQVMFGTTTHEIGDAGCRAGPMVHRPTRVGDGCWIGARATILPGVEIGEGCIIGAGAVVTRDCDPHGLYVGVPARRVKTLDV